MRGVIRSITTHAIEVPFDEPLAMSHGRHDSIRYVVVRATAEDGSIGHGEAREGRHLTSESQESIVAAIERWLAPAVLGMDPFDLNALHQAMDRACGRNTAAKSAVDMAAHDLAGRLSGQPLSRLLGGAPGDPLPSSKAISLGPVADMVAEARRCVDDGFGTLKIKVGIDEDAELAAIGSIRQAVGPEVALKLDANQGWSLVEASRFLDRVAPLDILMVEQPLPAWDLDGSAELRRRVAVPVMLDEGVHSPRDARRAIDSGAADFFSIKLVKSGGLFPALAIDAVADSAGIACQISSLDTTIGSAAAVHLAHARANIRFFEINGPTRMAWDVGQGFQCRDGVASVDPGPGLGITVDPERLDRPPVPA